jgi:hypothetical protein
MSIHAGVTMTATHPDPRRDRRPRRAFARATLLALALVASASPALACDSAEKIRLSDEQKSLAARNAWTGVERTYAALLATKCELGFEQHFLGAESAKLLGKVYEQYSRLELALAIAPEATEDSPDRSKEAIQASIDTIGQAYRKVRIVGDPRRRPVLSRPEMPFATDQRKAVEWAITVVSETGSFEGMLPFGAYVVGDVNFTAEAGADWQVVTVGKVKAPPPKPDGGPEGTPDVAQGGTQTQSFLRYASIVATVGPAFFGTPEPKKSYTMQSDIGEITQFSPVKVNLPGVTAQVGAELGLSYAEPALGLAGTVGFQAAGGDGKSTFLLSSLALSGVARPGELRLAAGPLLQYTSGRGTGVAKWVDIGHDASSNGSIRYTGRTLGPGLQGSVGYGLLDFDSLRGIVDLGGSWHTDGHRSYYTAGLRVGVVPAVPRFQQ